jgi:putative cofactor-binding repeat protein
MSSLFAPPRTREFTASGAPQGGAKLFFYRAGTSTPATTYQDAALTIPHTSPVVADIGGLFPAIWLDPTLSYDVTMTTLAGASLWSVEGLPASVAFSRTDAEESAGVTPTSYDYPEGDIRRYGAVGNGLTNNTTAIQTALNVAGVSGGEVFIPAGVFLSRSVAVPSGVTIRGTGRNSVIRRDSSWVGTAHRMFVVGSDAGNISDVSVRDFAIDMNGADSFAALIQIGQPTVSGTLYTASNIRITDMRFLDSAPFASAGDKWAVLWRAQLENVWVERCHSSDDMQLTAGGNDVHKNVNILHNRVVDGRANGIAMSIGDTNCVVEGIRVIGNHIECQALCIFMGPDSIYTGFLGGVWRNVTIANNTCLTNSDGTSDSTWIGIYLNAAAASYRDVTVTGNIIDCKDTLVSQRGIRLVDENSYGTTVSECAIQGNTIRNCRVGVDLIDAGRVVVDGNVITNCADGVVADSVALPSAVTDNLITGGTRAILVNNAELLVSGNVCAGGASQTGSTAGRLTIAPATGKTAKVMAVGNKFTDGSGGTNIYGVYGSVVGTAELHLIDNDLRGNDAAVNNITPTVAQGNLGYATANGGVTSAIATGTTVSHGLAAAPTIVTVTATSNGPTNVYVSAIGASTFTINYGGGGTHTFAWDAKTATFYG